MDPNLAPIITEVELDAPLPEVWAALTEPDRMRQWFFANIPDFKPRAGFTTAFPVKSEERTFVHLWKVVEVKPLQYIKVEWQFRDYPGKSHVTYSVKETEAGTKVRLETEVLAPFPQHIPEFKRESGVAGWDYFIRQQLPSYFNS